jgi:hypothetical protein
MKRFTGLVVITLVLLGASSAFGVPPTKLGFLSDDMSFQYCDYAVFKLDGFLASGYDNNSDCGYLDGARPVSRLATCQLQARSMYLVTPRLMPSAIVSAEIRHCW